MKTSNKRTPKHPRLTPLAHAVVRISKSIAPDLKSLHWLKINEYIDIKFFLSHTRSSQVHNQCLNAWSTGWLVPLMWVSAKDAAFYWFSGKMRQI